MNLNWNKPQVHEGPGRVRREEKIIGEGKEKIQNTEDPPDGGSEAEGSKFRVECSAKLSLDLTKSLCLKAQQHLA